MILAPIGENIAGSSRGKYVSMRPEEDGSPVLLLIVLLSIRLYDIVCAILGGSAHFCVVLVCRFVCVNSRRGGGDTNSAELGLGFLFAPGICEAA